ncbi:hypothetical protein ACF0H5_000809 [Mactra antiquata]
MDEPSVLIKRQSRPKTRWYVNFADFANMVKAFIGSNYLYVAFAFSQSGVVLGAIGMSVIAALTDHCCHLIVKTKHHGIEKMIKKKKLKTQPSSTGQYNSYDSVPKDSGVDEDDDEDVDAESSAFIGRSADIDDDSDSSDIESEFETIDNSEIKEHMTSNMSYGDVGKLAFGGIGVAVVNFCIALTQFGFCVNYFIFIGNTVHALFPIHLCFNVSNTRVCKTIHDEDINGGITTVLPTTTTSVNNYSTISPNSSTIAPNITTTETSWSQIGELIYTAPDLRILVVCPIIIFIIFALIRSVRYLGVISVLANLSILFGCVSVFFFLVIGFEVHKSIKFFNIKGFPIFFGMVTGAFEGIGLVIPVESSMVGNRHLFSAFLHGAILFLTMLLAFFGILGYLRFGEGVHQMLNTNIPSGDPISVAVNIGICIGILLTFPLQIFPVIEIVEKNLFATGRLCGPKHTVDTSEEEALMSSDKSPLLDDQDHVVAHIPDSVPAWKRNIVRILIVLVAGGLAVVLRNNFAYVGAFVGAVGSSALAFILPCLFHLKLCWQDISVFIKIKDFIIIIFGIFASIISVISVIQRLVNEIDV